MREIWSLFIAVGLLLCSFNNSHAEILAHKYTSPQQLEIGSPNTATADPSIPRPNTIPCIVELFQDFVFVGSGTGNQAFDYSPAEACPGPWEKVIFEGNFSVEAGVQFDRTATVWLGGANIYFGTTMEPTPFSNEGRDWHVESDLTDYSPLFSQEQTGQVILINGIDETLTSAIFGSARLLFYPLEPESNTSETADQIIPLANNSDGGLVAVTSSNDVFSKTTEFPTNIERVYIDVFAQGQTTEDEFWYTCVPDDVADELQSCPSTAFRETQITIDGQPAGVAPIFPWIFTGGTNPLMWRPIPGVETLNFVPYRVDLTPFAGLLNDGQPHEVAISVFNVNHFSVTANLLLYLDEGSTQVTGAVTKNTIGTPNTIVEQSVETIGNVLEGNILVRSYRNFELAGFVNTSHGRVDTTISQQVNFSNQQEIEIIGSVMNQDVNQITTVNSETTIQKAGEETKVVSLSRTWPLQQENLQVIFPDGTITRETSVLQEREETEELLPDGYRTNFLNRVTPLAEAINPHQAFSEGVGESQQHYSLHSDSTVFNQRISASLGVLRSISNGGGSGSSCSIGLNASASSISILLLIPIFLLFRRILHITD